MIRFAPRGGPQPLRQSPPGTPWQLHLRRENPARLCPAAINPHLAAPALLPFHRPASPPHEGSTEAWGCCGPRCCAQGCYAWGRGCHGASSCNLPAWAAAWPQPEPGDFAGEALGRSFTGLILSMDAAESPINPPTPQKQERCGAEGNSWARTEGLCWMRLIQLFYALKPSTCFTTGAVWGPAGLSPNISIFKRIGFWHKQLFLSG